MTTVPHDILKHFVDDILNDAAVSQNIARIQNERGYQIEARPGPATYNATDHILDCSVMVTPVDVPATKTPTMDHHNVRVFEVKGTPGTFEIEALDKSARLIASTGRVTLVQGKIQPQDGAAYLEVVARVGRWLVSAAEGLTERR